MKLYRNLSIAVVEALAAIFDDNRYADKVIEKIFKQNKQWGARDRKFIAESVYEIVRWLRLFQVAGESSPKDYWSLLGTWIIWKGLELPSWPEFENLKYKKIAERLEARYPTAIQQSIPDWLDELGRKELKERWDDELPFLNEEASVVLRVNNLKTSLSDLREILLEDNIETSVDNRFEDALILAKRSNVFASQSFKDGLFEVQDAGSQLIAPYARAEAGMRVVDACAGAGGKSLHLSAMMQNRGKIIAMDTEEWKLDELKKRARRAGAMNIETRVIESSKSIKRLHESADRLLLDVPCSGLGVLRRNPDAKWKLSLEYIEKVKEIQQKILSDYSSMLKKGGVMIYSTCSILPSENTDQVKQFISNHLDSFKLLEEKFVWPSEGFDGFYMAAIEKK
ncbi:MAG: RsmB/NOP family class I SAM-dependent RNA methyltransferase [Cyclobacteriaceae bacterium]